MRVVLFTLIVGVMGMAHISGATAAETIKIDWIGPLSGWGAAGGTAMMRGTQLAIAYLNAKGGIEGRQLELDLSYRRSEKDSWFWPVSAAKMRGFRAIEPETLSDCL